MAGRDKNPRKKGKKPLSNGWIVVPSKTYPDRVYFYNTVTRCSTWNNPCEDRSDEESPERSFSLSSKKPSQKSHSKKHKSDTVLHSPDRNCNNKVNSEIEDYDDHDQYFSEVHINASNTEHLHTSSPPSSPDSVSSFKTNISDSDNILLENNKKQLWTHFVSTPNKPKVKKSVALSDFEKASTSHIFEMGKSNEGDKNNTFLRNKSKKKKAQTSSEKKNAMDKIIKDVSFKRKDKTPSQTRLLKLKKQNAEKLRELAAKYPELGIGVGRSSEKSRHSNAFDGKEQMGQQKAVLAIPGKDNDHLDYEEMDWEPSCEESDVRNINEFRQLIDKPSEPTSYNFFGLNLDSPSALPSKTHSWFIVLDTNIFVSCLPFVKELRDTKVTDLGYPVIYVPWRVLQELDHLKDTKLDSVDRSLLMNVRRAIGYLNDNFKSRHPRIFGQSFEDFEKMIDVNTSQFAPDDEILQTCIHLQKQHGDKKLMLLTNDKNLESKAIVSGVEVYSKERFQKELLKSNTVPSQIMTGAINQSNISRADDCFCQLKAVLKDFLSMLVETEMKAAFGKDWIKIAVKKPPWSLEDVMKCLLKHWRAVFFLVFSRDIHSKAELLNEQLFKKHTVTIERLQQIIGTAERLLISIKKSLKKNAPYLNLIPTTMSRLSDLLKMLTPSQADVNSSSCQSVSWNCNSQQLLQTVPSSSDVLKVTALFKEIWDSLRNFCCSLSDIIHSLSNEVVVQEIRLKLSQVLNEVTELVATVEKILEINPSDINECHPVISHFSNFLIMVYPNMVPNLKNDMPRCLAKFFTDFEGRSLISRSLNDFKEFLQDITKASQYFDAQLSSVQTC